MHGGTDLGFSSKSGMKTLPWNCLLLFISRLNKILISDYFEPHENFSNYLTRTG